MKLLLGVGLLLSVVSGGFSYFVTVDAHAEECFFDRVDSGTKLGLTFEVAEGGFLDIDVEVNRSRLFQYKAHRTRYFDIAGRRNMMVLTG